MVVAAYSLMVMDMTRILDGATITVDITREAIRRHRVTFAAIRARQGFKEVHTALVTGTNEKYGKSAIPTFGVSLAQASLSGYNVCRYATVGCRAVCVGQNGNGTYDDTKNGRMARNTLLAEDPSAFLSIMVHELTLISKRHGGNVAFRLNTFSDIPWERYLPEWVWSLGVFYDYTKWSRNARADMSTYALVRSVTELWTIADIVAEARVGAPVVVFDIGRGKPMVETFVGFPVTDGDATDERFADGIGTIVGVRAKGKRTLARELEFSRIP